MAAGSCSLCCSPCRTQAPGPVGWQTNGLYAQVLGTGRFLVVCTPRVPKLGIIQYQVMLFFPRQAAKMTTESCSLN